ncbi:MAG: hypothetical protein ABEJ05_04830 [Haloglomus sp.]
MVIDSLSNSLAPLVALLALPSVAVFLLSRGQPFIAVAAVNVCLIAGSLWYVVTREGSGGHGAAHA